MNLPSRSVLLIVASLALAAVPALPAHTTPSDSLQDGAAAVAEASVAAPLTPAQRTALAAAVPMPFVEFGLSVNFSMRRGFMMSGGEADDKAEALAKLKELRAEPEPTGALDRAERLLQVARLQEDAGDDKGAESTTRSAVALLRKKARPARADDADSLRTAVLLGRALLHTGGGARDEREAEALLRRTAEAAPKSPEVWAALGEAVGRFDVGATLLGATGAAGPPPLAEAPDFPGLASQMHTRFRAPGVPAVGPAVDAMARRYREAAECFTRSIELAPARPGAYLGRAANRMMADLLANLRDEFEHPDSDTVVAAAAQVQTSVLLQPGLLEDVQRAAERTPDDPAAIAASRFFPVAARGMSGATFREASSSLAGPLEEWLACHPAPIDGKAEAPGVRRRRVRVLETLGAVYLAKDDLPAAEERLRQALALDADRTAAFRHQMAGLAMGGRYADMIGPLRERLARRPEAVHNVILAKALVKLGRVAEAEEATRRRTTGRGTTDGDRRLFALARAAVLLKDPSPVRFRLQEADTLLDGLEADRPQLETHQRWLLTLLRGAYHAVSDDRAKAEAAFREVRDGAGGDADAHKASNELLNALAAS